MFSAAACVSVLVLFEDIFCTDGRPITAGFSSSPSQPTVRLLSLRLCLQAAGLLIHSSANHGFFFFHPGDAY